MGKKHPYSGKSVSTNFPGSPHTMGFVGFSRKPISKVFPIWWVVLPFPMLWETNEKIHAVLMWWSISQDLSLIGKNHPFYGISIGANFPELSWWVSLTFLMLWKFDEKTHAFSIRWTIGSESDEKKPPYYGKSMNTNFPSSSHLMGFGEYYREPIFQAFSIR